MIKGIGVDIVGIERIRNIKNDRDFIGQLLNSTEQSAIRGNHQSPIQIGSIFALKEAVMKALGCGLTYGSRWHDIEVREDGRIILTGKLKEIADGAEVTTIHSSYSYSKKYLTTFVILEG